MTKIKEGWETVAARTKRQPKYDRCGQPMLSNYEYYQCSHPAKHDENQEGMPTRCGIHSRDAVKRRLYQRVAKAEEAKQDRIKKTARNLRKREYIRVLHKIANRHNDPARLATEYLDSVGVGLDETLEEDTK